MNNNDKERWDFDHLMHDIDSLMKMIYALSPQNLASLDLDFGEVARFHLNDIHHRIGKFNETWGDNNEQQ